MSFVKRSLGAIGLAAACAAGLAAEDLSIVQKRTSDGKQPETLTSYVTSDRMRMSGAEGQEFMAEFAKSQFTVIDHKKKQYFVSTKQEMDAAFAKLEAQMQQTREQMKSLPPAIQEKMAAAMGGMTTSLKVEKGAGTRQVAGYTCQEWVMTWGEMMKQTQCVTTQLAWPVQAWDAQRSMFGGAPGIGQAMAKIVDEMKKMNGMPLAGSQTMQVMGRKSSSTWETTEIKKGPVPASAWEIPAGYKKVDSPFAKLAKE